MTRPNPEENVRALQRLLSSNFGERAQGAINSVERQVEFIEARKKRQQREQEIIKNISRQNKKKKLQSY